MDHAQSRGEEDAEDHDLEDLAVGGRLEEALGKDVDEDFGERLGFGGDARDVPAAEMDADAGLDDIDEEQSEEKGDRRHDLEIDERLETHPADGLEVAVAGDPDDDRGKDEGGDDRLDEADEDLAQRPEGRPDIGKDRPDEKPQAHADEYIESQAALLFSRFGGHVRSNVSERCYTCQRSAGASRGEEQIARRARAVSLGRKS